MFTHGLLKEQNQHTGPLQVLEVPKQGIGRVGRPVLQRCKWICPGGGAGAQGQVLSVEGAGRLRRDLSCLTSYHSVTQLCLTLCSPMDCSTLGFPCPSPIPGACSNSCPLSWWCHPTISSSVVPFSHLQSFPASGSFPVSQLFSSGGQGIGGSYYISVFPMNIQG